MKKLFIILMMFAFHVSLAASSIDEIIIEQVEDKGGRSIVIAPRVWFDAATMELSTAYSNSGTYDISLQDAKGVTICQFSCIANGVLQRYNIQNLDNETYYVIIRTDKWTFNGEVKL